MTALPLPEALLRDTFRRMAERYPAWPQEFDLVMADPLRSRLVRLTATRRAAAARGRTASPPAPPASRPSAAARRLSPRPVHHPDLDRKRAAAGDRDD